MTPSSTSGTEDPGVRIVQHAGRDVDHPAGQARLGPGVTRARDGRDDHGLVVGELVDLGRRDPARRELVVLGARRGQVERPGLAVGLPAVALGQRALAGVVVGGQHRRLEGVLGRRPVVVLLPPRRTGHVGPRIGLVAPVPGQDGRHLAGRGLGPVGQLGLGGHRSFGTRRRVDRLADVGDRLAGAGSGVARRALAGLLGPDDGTRPDLGPVDLDRRWGCRPCPSIRPGGARALCGPALSTAPTWSWVSFSRSFSTRSSSSEEMEPSFSGPRGRGGPSGEGCGWPPGPPRPCAGPP